MYYLISVFNTLFLITKVTFPLATLFTDLLSNIAALNLDTANDRELSAVARKK